MEGEGPAGAGEPSEIDKEVSARGGDVVKVILLGDSAVGKSKLVERFLMDGYQPQQLSTYALTLFRHDAELPLGPDGAKVKIAIDFWDTAGQERFNSMHPSYYYKAHCCLMVFDVGRKSTYKNLSQWYTELREHCPTIPTVVCANKIDINKEVTKKAFNFPTKHNLPLFFASAADGTNVVAMFEEAITLGHQYKTSDKGADDFLGDVMDLLEEGDLGGEKDELRLKDKAEMDKLTELA
jgi:Rab-like protein 2